MEIQTVLLSAVCGDGIGEYLVMGNWNYEPINPEEITCCVLLVKSTLVALEWRILYSIKTWVNSINRLSSASYMLGTADGDIIRLTNGIREVFGIGNAGFISSIWGASEDDCWIAHKRGLSHFNGKSIDRVIATGMMFKIHSSDSNFSIAVGAGGMVQRFDGVDWSQVESVPTNVNFVGVHCVSRSEIYISGWDGILYRWDGLNKWLKIGITTAGVDENLTVQSPVGYLDSVYVCISGRGLYKVEGRAARNVKSFDAISASVIDKNL